MSYKKACLILICYLSISTVVIAQKERNIWYFGYGAGLDFNQGTPVVLTDGVISTYEGCASVADLNGDLLFYTDGISVWNKNHQVMMNGNGLFGHASSTQSAIILHKPGDPHKYYIFTTDVVNAGITAPGNGLRYSIVDMQQQGGLGAVTTKNVSLLGGRTTEKLTATRHANGNGYWVIAHVLHSDAFHAFEVTAAGVNPVSVVSHTGTFHNGLGPYQTWHYQGYLKASPSGKKLANGVSYATGFIEILDFDPATGQASNPIHLPVWTPVGIYGVEFSPDETLLYAQGENGGIFQYDLTAGSATAINNSMIPITSAYITGGAMQLGPDNRIYCSGDYYVHVIASPNVHGFGCDFRINDIHLKGKRSGIGFPNFLPLVQSPFFGWENDCFGDSTFFLFNDTTGITTVSWDFGDPATGSLNFSSGVAPYHLYSDTGTFLVQVIISYTSVFTNTLVHDTLRDTIYIGSYAQPDLGPDTLVCAGDTLWYDVSFPGANYLWQDNSTDSVYVITQPGTYQVALTNYCGTRTDTVVVNHDSLKKPVDFNDTLICKGSTFRLDASAPGLTYLWQDLSTDSVFDVYQAGIYWIEWQNDCGLIRDTIDVGYIADPDPDLGMDTMICFGDRLELNATQNGVSSYLWQDGSTDSIFQVTHSGIYWVTVSSPCDVRSDTIVIDLLFPPEVYLGEDTTLCRRNTLLLDAGNEGASYLWQDGSTGRYMHVTREDHYWVDVTNLCDTGNDSLLALFMYPPIVDLGSDTVICEQDVLQLDVSNTASTYLWQDQSTGPYFYAGEAGTYEVTVKNACGIESDVIEVEVKNCQCRFYVPNTFTPNGDQLNDAFKIYHDCVLLQFELTVLDRWGEVVYKSTHPETSWDGTLNGKQMPTDTYAWTIRYAAMDGNQQQKEQIRGLVQLIR